MSNSKILVKRPSDFNPIANVSACYFGCLDLTLFLKRVNSSSQGDTWCIPGGKSESSETPVEAVFREVFEETGVRLDNSVQLMKTLYVRYPEHDFTFHMFYQKFLEKPKIRLDPNEHESYRWVTLEEAKLLPMILGGIETLYYYEQFIGLGME